MLPPGGLVCGYRVIICIDYAVFANFSWTQRISPAGIPYYIRASYICSGGSASYSGFAEECFPVFIWDGGPVHGGYRNSESGCI